MCVAYWADKHNPCGFWLVAVACGLWLRLRLVACGVWLEACTFGYGCGFVAVACGFGMWLVACGLWLVAVAAAVAIIGK